LSNVRVTYSGLIAFVISISSVFTGIIFTLIVTRNLSVQDFGLWTLIGSLISYVIIYEVIISFWTSRQVARDQDVGKTALVTSGLLSSISFILFLVVAFFVSDTVNINLDILFIAAIMAPLLFISNTLTGINLGHRPEATSYGVLFFEIFKIPVGLTLVYFLELGIIGALITIIISYLIKILIQIYFAKPKLNGIFNYHKILYWFKFSWLPMYITIPGFIWTLDVLVFSAMTNSVEGLAFYGASMAIGNIVVHSGMISQGLYPKLLSGGESQFFENSFSKVLYFAIPLLFIAILFSKSGLFVLNSAYQDASIIVIIYSIRSFFYVIGGTFTKSLQGLEKIDESELQTFSQLLKSKLVLIPTLNLIHYSSYVISLVIVLTILIPYNLSFIELITYWVMISLIIQIPFTIIPGILLYKKIHFHISFKNIIKFLIGSIAMVLVFFITSDEIIVYENSIFIFLPRVILQFAICGVTYLGVTYMIDKNTRSLFKSIITELTGKK